VVEIGAVTVTVPAYDDVGVVDDDGQELATKRLAGCGCRGS